MKNTDADKSQWSISATTLTDKKVEKVEITQEEQKHKSGGAIALGCITIVAIILMVVLWFIQSNEREEKRERIMREKKEASIYYRLDATKIFCNISASKNKKLEEKYCTYARQLEVLISRSNEEMEEMKDLMNACSTFRRQKSEFSPLFASIYQVVNLHLLNSYNSDKNIEKILRFIDKS
jgi:uncharacterized protein HemX